MPLEIRQVDKQFPQSCFLRHENGELCLLLNSEDVRLLGIDLREVLAFAARATRYRAGNSTQVALRKLEDLMRSIEEARQPKSS
jgi:hypothetical protein